ncbi:DUF6756 family protein [Roseivirga sp.]|uniref:DUF6756 family protein n=1 Tax=Roseivirga sp. TaxID=1964215 RepID=UPI003B523F6C
MTKTSKERLVKSKIKRTWTDLRVEIQKLCIALNISNDDFSEVNINEWREIESNIWTNFSSKKNSRWIWETLANSYETAPFSHNNLELEEFISPSEKVWILLDEATHEKTKFWIYEGTVRAFDQLFRESFWTYEVLIVSKKYEWILILNHHSTMIGTGILKDLITEFKRNGNNI